MNILSQLMIILEPVGLPVETGYFSGTPPDEYIVLIPIVDSLGLYADNLPLAQTDRKSVV